MRIIEVNPEGIDPIEVKIQVASSEAKIFMAEVNEIRTHTKANIKMMAIKAIITRANKDFIITHVEISLRVIAMAIPEVEAVAEAEAIIVVVVTVGPIIKVSELLPYRESNEKVVYDRPQTKHHLAYMDDCLVHSKKKVHLYHIVALLKALIKHGLKMSPKKSLTYMGHTLMVKDQVPYITPLKSRVHAITKMNPPTNVKECRQFCGMVNYLSMFLESLQMILVPIYNLTRKKIKFQWYREQQEAFQKIKTLLIKPPILMIPNGTDLFTMYSDTSKKGCGASLWQMQGNQNKLVGYHSKTLPDAVSRYSISELELTGLASNISGFKHLLSKTGFTVYVMPTGMEETPKAALDIHCLWRGGGVALTQTIN